MKPFDWTLLAISVFWFVTNILRIWAMLDTKEVKYYGARIVVGWSFWIPMIMWLIIAYRVGG
jgi:hypothetical protein